MAQIQVGAVDRLWDRVPLLACRASKMQAKAGSQVIVSRADAIMQRHQDLNRVTQASYERSMHVRRPGMDQSCRAEADKPMREAGLWLSSMTRVGAISLSRSPSQGPRQPLAL